jgi:hypothetical protein
MIIVEDEVVVVMIVVLCEVVLATDGTCDAFALSYFH